MAPTVEQLLRRLEIAEGQVVQLQSQRPIRGPAGARGPRGLDGAPGADVSADVILYTTDESTAGVNAAIVAQLNPSRRGIGGPTRLRKDARTDSTYLLMESADGQKLVGEGQYATQRSWVSPGPAGIPHILADQVRAAEIGDLRLTASVALLEFLRMQDDEIEPTDPTLKYAGNRRSTQNLIRRMQLDGGGLAQFGIRFYLATEAGGKNDHHQVTDITIDSYLHTGFVVEGQASTAHKLDKLVIRSGIGGVTRGLYGVRTGIMPYDFRAASNAFAVTSVDAGADSYTKVAHGRQTGEGPAYWTTSGTLPAGLALATPYWFIRLTADTFKVASSLANALAGTPVAISDTGSGTHSIGGNWSSIVGKGGTFRMYGGEVLDNDVSDFRIDSRNGCVLIDGVTMEGSARFCQVVSPSPSTALCVVRAVSCKWTSGTLAAADGEVWQHEGQAAAEIAGCQFGLATGLKEIRFYQYSLRDHIGWSFVGNEITGPYKHGHFTGLYPDNVAGSKNIDGSGNVTPILYPWDGPAGSLSAPGRSVPYTAEQWLDRDHPAPDQWYPCQESRQEIPVTAVDTGADTLTANDHALDTGSGPHNLIVRGGSHPTGIAGDSTDLYIIRQADKNKLKVASSLANALAGTAIDLTGAGSGTMELVTKGRASIYSAAKGRTRKDMILRAATEPTDWPRLHQRRSVESSAWHGYWIEFTGALGQVLSWSDTGSYIDGDNMSLALDMIVDITAKGTDDRFLCVLGLGGTTGLNVRVMSTGFLKIWCNGSSVTGAVDYTTVGPTFLRLIYNRAATTVKLLSFDEAPLVPTYNATVGHTQHIGIGSSSTGSPSFVGFLRHAALYRGKKAELLGEDLTRRGF